MIKLTNAIIFIALVYLVFLIGLAIERSNTRTESIQEDAEFSFSAEEVQAVSAAAKQYCDKITPEKEQQDKCYAYFILGAVWQKVQ